MHTFAAILRHLRIHRDLTQDGLAARAGCSVSVIAKAEQHGKLPSDRLQRAIAMGLHQVRPLTAADVDAWAAATGIPSSFLQDDSITAAVLDHIAPGLTTPPTDHAAAAHAALSRLLARTSPAAVLGLLTAAEHLVAGQAQPPAAAASLAVWPGSVRTSSTGPDGQPVTVYHPTTQPTPAADPQRRAKPQAGQ